MQSRRHALFQFGFYTRQSLQIACSNQNIWPDVLQHSVAETLRVRANMISARFCSGAVDPETTCCRLGQRGEGFVVACPMPLEVKHNVAQGVSNVPKRIGYLAHWPRDLEDIRLSSVESLRSDPDSKACASRSSPHLKSMLYALLMSNSSEVPSGWSAGLDFIQREQLDADMERVRRMQNGLPV